jgi:naringenin degradation protein FdeD
LTRHLCPFAELPDPGSRGFTAAAAGAPWDLFVVRLGEAVYGYRNSCPHTGAPLEWLPDRFLDITESMILCGIHGALFRIQDGRCVRGPCAGQGLTPVRVWREGEMVVWDEG